MSSIFVDTIRKIGGTLGTDIRVKTTSVYESENSTGTTQNLVQSLTKAWVNHDQATVNDSFNVGSVTDNGTGDSGHNFTNNMANIHYVGSGMGVHDSGSYSTFMSYDHDDPFTTAQATVNQQLVNQNLHDAEPVNTMYAGDLA
jgi:hypothetical protein|tara:strand:+ start:148 stop:576 length:429 start_codon:yes stop_codon:yes gene_type:complete